MWNISWWLLKWGWLTGIIPAAIGFVVGMLVWKNNAKKFKRLEEQAKAKGKTFADLIK